MSPYRIDALRKQAVLNAILASALCCCGIVDMRPVVVVTKPELAYQILEARDDSLHVTFSSEPEHLAAERAFLVKSPAGTIEGDFLWEGSGFIWEPVSPWDPGVRYRLILKGLIPILDGREASPEIDIPFFVLRSGSQPTLLRTIPGRGASVSVQAGSLPVLHLEFSEAMNKLETENAFTLKPTVDCDHTWNIEQTTLAITPRDQLSACIEYRWSLGAGARAQDGTPLGRSENGTFLTNLDAIPPRVERVYPVIRSGDTWVEAAADITGLDAGHSLAILFSEQVDPVTAVSGIRIEPSLAGRADAIAPRLVVYTPERDWLPGQSLTLLVSGDVKDVSGLTTGEEYALRFMPIVPYLLIRSARSGLLETTSDLSGSSILAAELGNAPDGVCTLTLEFSAPFDAAGKTATGERISLATFFPSWLPSPALRDVCWLSDDTVALTWEGLRANEAGTINYYRLLIPGGQGGIHSGKDLFLQDDCSLYMEVQQ